jgi:hypothetical protein
VQQIMGNSVQALKSFKRQQQKSDLTTEEKDQYAMGKMLNSVFVDIFDNCLFFIDVHLAVTLI